MSSTFSYVKYDELSAAQQLHLRTAFEEVERLVSYLADGRAKSLVLTKLEEAYMWTGKAVRDEQILRTGKVDEQPERSNG